MVSSYTKKRIAHLQFSMDKCTGLVGTTEGSRLVTISSDLKNDFSHSRDFLFIHKNAIAWIIQMDVGTFTAESINKFFSPSVSLEKISVQLSKL